MSVTFKNCTAIGAQVGFAAPENSDTHFDGNQTINCGVGYLIYNGDFNPLAIGLLPSTPPDQLLKLLKFIEAEKGVEPHYIQQKFEQLGLADYLGIGADLTTIVSNLVSLADTPQLASLIAFLVAKVGG